MSRTYRTCDACIEYAEVRRSTIGPAMRRYRQVTGETAEEILDRFMSGVHDRHLTGFPILPGRAA